MKNRDMLRAVLAEMDTSNPPRVLCGDFNADWDVYPELSEAAHARRLLDVEAIPEMAGTGLMGGTCRAHGSK
eukprot:1849358-Alexandrium_andersonii.AAC.1